MTRKHDSIGVDDHLPLKPTDYLTLVALTERDSHGYGLVKRIEELSGGTVRLVPGNFYSVLSRLMEAGLLEESARRESADLDNRKRRYYAITLLGREVASAETSRLKALIKAAEEYDLARSSGRAR